MNRKQATELLMHNGIRERVAIKMVNEAERLSESVTVDSLKVRCEQLAGLAAPHFSVVTFEQCRHGDSVATCYHLPRCRWVWGYGKGQPFGRFVPVREDTGTDCLSELVIAGGLCTLCENDADELLPWGGCERLCWACVDLNLDLLAKAVSEAHENAGEVMVTA